MIWEIIPATKNVAKLYLSGHYVISERQSGNEKLFVLSFRPPGKHIHLGNFNYLIRAKKFATLHKHGYT